MNTMIQKKVVVVALVAAGGLQSCALAQNLVVNGGFDTNAAGWTAVNNSPYGGYACCKGNPGGCFWLDANPSPTTDPTVSQVVSGLIPGNSYTVSGDYAKLIDRGGGSGLSFGVALDSTAYYESNQTDFAWHSFGFHFNAASTSVNLSISAQMNGTGVAYQIDNIVLQQTPSVVARVSGSAVVLSWPTNALGFSLQTSTNLATGSWVAVTNPPAVSSTNYTTTLSVSSGLRFFRLGR